MFVCVCVVPHVCDQITPDDFNERIFPIFLFLHAPHYEPVWDVVSFFVNLTM